MTFKIENINHITYTVENIEKSIEFYKNVLQGKLLAKGDKLAYFEIAGTWIALNTEKNIQAVDRQKTYTHLAFSMSQTDQEAFVKHLEKHKVNYTKGRPRATREGQSVYVRDYDGHLFEFHNRTLKDRLDYYREEREDIEVYI